MARRLFIWIIKCDINDPDVCFWISSMHGGSFNESSNSWCFVVSYFEKQNIFLTLWSLNICTIFVMPVTVLSELALGRPTKPVVNLWKLYSWVCSRWQQRNKLFWRQVCIHRSNPWWKIGSADCVLRYICQNSQQRNVSKRNR